jgi:GNAT superfamily N-acetyltransferase
MQIREAIPADIPEIVSLLKQSLGETLMPKSVGYWNWKHNENPFGKSPVLVARERGEIIGVRAFMRWQWVYNNEIFNAVRAVDTATHPSFQGKGIFKKLTLSLLEFCKANNDSFVFNTPNKSSKPGYIKMGWRACGNLPIYFYPIKPIKILRNLILGRQGSVDLSVEQSSLAYYLDHPALDELIAANKKLSVDYIVSNHSREYFKWRYRDNPVAYYAAHGLEEDNRVKGLLFYRLKTTKAGNELRITDILADDASTAKRLVSGLTNKIKNFETTDKIDYLTISGCSSHKVFSWFIPRLKIGPVVTFREINRSEFNMMNNFNTWRPSLGDLELF